MNILNGEGIRVESSVGKWDGWYEGKTAADIGAFRYGDTVTYQMAADFLADMETVEDWGCGLGGFKRFRPQGYIGIDGSLTPVADKIADLSEYRSDVDGIVMRHVLEHNYGWSKILAGAIDSCRKKLCLILFTPFAEITTEIGNDKAGGVDVPIISFARVDIERLFAGHNFRMETVVTATAYGQEHIYFVELKGVKK